MSGEEQCLKAFKEYNEMMEEQKKFDDAPVNSTFYSKENHGNLNYIYAELDRIFKIK